MLSSSLDQIPLAAVWATETSDEARASSATSGVQSSSGSVVRKLILELSTNRRGGAHIPLNSTPFKLPLTTVSDYLVADFAEPSALERTVSDQLFGSGIPMAPVLADVRKDLSARLVRCRGNGCTVRTLLDAEATNPSSNYISTGNPALDLVLQGGWRRRTVTEVAGVAGSGKTQIALQTLTDWVTRSESNRSIYLVSEDIPHQRMAQLAREASRKQNYGTSISSEADILERILIRQVSSLQELSAALISARQLIVSGRENGLINAPLVVIDSIAACCVQGEGKGVPEKELELQPEAGSSSVPSSELLRVGSELKRFCEEANVAVVVINQVRQKPGAPHPVPALGITWSCVPHSRVMLTFEGGNSIPMMDSTTNTIGRRRRFQISTSCYLNSSAGVGYWIDASGVRCDESDR
jgi:RecA/RadA recombinase